MATKDEDELLEALFPEDWYKRVLAAVDFAVHKLGCTGRDAIALSKDIIDYNIERRLDRALTECADILLPREIDWSRISVENAFEAFNALLETCEVCKRVKSYKARIKFGKNNVVYNEFLIWKELSSAKFPTLQLKLSKTRQKDTFTLLVQKVKQSKSRAKG